MSKHYKKIDVNERFFWLFLELNMQLLQRLNGCLVVWNVSHKAAVQALYVLRPRVGVVLDSAGQALWAGLEVKHFDVS